MQPINEAIQDMEILQTLIFRISDMCRPFSNNDLDQSRPERKHGIFTTGKNSLKPAIARPRITKSKPLPVSLINYTYIVIEWL